MELLKSVVGKVAAGMVALGVIAGGISWWQMEPETRQMLVHGVERICYWLGIVLLLPWASSPFIGWVARKAKSNKSGITLVSAYTLVECVLFAWLFQWQIRTSTAWLFLIFSGLIAATYNLLICDWIAERFAP